MILKQNQRFREKFVNMLNVIWLSKIIDFQHTILHVLHIISEAFES